jgi:small subunit ribosomal protein S4
MLPRFPTMVFDHQRFAACKPMRYTGPTNRLSRRENLDLGHKTQGSKAQASLMKRLGVLPGQHGTPKRRKVSEYGRQVHEKQKLRFMFGVTETVLKNYFTKAKKKTGNTSLYLSQYLEQRLDNTLYRLGLAPTRAMARQLVGHGHVSVNGKLLSVASYQVRVGDQVSIAKEKSLKIPAVVSIMENKDTMIPEWLERKGPVGKAVSHADASIIEKQINLRLVIEYYSR